MKNVSSLSIIALIVALLFSGCLESKNKPITTVGQAILAAEANGIIPKLNHDNTIAGPDGDKNGIRDDIDAYIATLPYTEVQKKAVQQNARALNATLTVEKTDKTALADVSNKLVRAVVCIHDQFISEPGRASKLSSDNEKMIVNTKIRFLEYEKYNSARSGSVTRLPDRKTSCDN
jgi:hypothetical protein